MKNDLSPAARGAATASATTLTVVVAAIAAEWLTVAVFGAAMSPLRTLLFAALIGGAATTSALFERHRAPAPRYGQPGDDILVLNISRDSAARRVVLAAADSLHQSEPAAAAELRGRVRRAREARLQAVRERVVRG